MVAAKRRNYLAWCGALLDLWAVLSRPGMLDTIEITAALSVLAPWRSTPAWISKNVPLKRFMLSQQLQLLV